VGDREQEGRTVGLREHRKGDEGAVEIDDFVQRVRSESVARAE